MSCERCDDTGWKPIDVDGVRRVVRCECWRDQLGEHRLAAANIPKRYLHCTLDNFEAYNPSLEQALAQASGNQTRAADLLGLTRDQFRYRMKKIRGQESAQRPAYRAAV